MKADASAEICAAAGSAGRHAASALENFGGPKDLSMTQPLRLHLRDVANIVTAGSVEVWAAHLLQLRCLLSRRTSPQLDAAIHFQQNTSSPFPPHLDCAGDPRTRLRDIFCRRTTCSILHCGLRRHRSALFESLINPDCWCSSLYMLDSSTLTRCASSSREQHAKLLRAAYLIALEVALKAIKCA